VAPQQSAFPGSSQVVLQERIFYGDERSFFPFVPEEFRFISYFFPDLDLSNKVGSLRTKKDAGVEMANLTTTLQVTTIKRRRVEINHFRAGARRSGIAKPRTVTCAGLTAKC